MVIHEHHTAPYTHWHWYETSCHGRRATENGLPDVRLLSKPAAWVIRMSCANHWSRQFLDWERSAVTGVDCLHREGADLLKTRFRGS